MLEPHHYLVAANLLPEEQIFSLLDASQAQRKSDCVGAEDGSDDAGLTMMAMATGQHIERELLSLRVGK